MVQVILIYPCDPKTQSSIYPPLGLSYIYSYLKYNGITPLVIDLTFSEMPKISGQNNIYVISCTTALYDRTKKITAELKCNDSNCIVCIGGSHPTVMPEYVLNDDKNTDIVVIGEGEQTIYEICQGLALPSIKGICYRHNGIPTFTDKRQHIKEIDTLPFPDQSCFDIEKYFSIKGFRELTMISSRGCSSNCSFCQPTIRKIFGNVTRFRTPKNVVDELEYIVKTHNLDMITFSDDTFTSSKTRIQAICNEIIDRNIHILWRCQTRVNIDLYTLKLMKRSGCFLISFGVESGSEQILKNINKNITTDEIKTVFGLAKKVGILTYAFLMVGNQGESDYTINASVSLIKEIRPTSGNVSITTPYPGSHLYELMPEKEICWEKYIHISNHTITINNISKESVTKWKSIIEISLASESQKIKDIYGLMKDLIIPVKIIKMSLKDRMFIIRITKLLIRFSKQKYGFQSNNPYTIKL